jgi:hypothetical protein
VNRRHFLGQVVLGSTLVSSLGPRAHASSQSPGVLRIKFVGLMGYITRSDQSLLVALPGAHALGHYHHVPFLMARSGSAIAHALGLAPMSNVVPGAFDDRLVNEAAGSFVFRCLDGCDLGVDGGAVGVDNRATQLAQMGVITRGKRIRNDLRRWSSASITLRGGRLDNSAAHPDAGKIWKFGTHQQQLTDATLYSVAGSTIRLEAGANVASFQPAPGETADLWVVSSAGPRGDIADPKRLAHASVLFQYFADAESVIPTCDEAEGRITLASELPCAPNTLASMRMRAATVMPPHVDLCPGMGCCI